MLSKPFLFDFKINLLSLSLMQIHVERKTDHTILITFSSPLVCDIYFIVIILLHFNDKQAFGEKCYQNLFWSQDLNFTSFGQTPNRGYPIMKVLAWMTVEQTLRLVM